MKYQLQQIIWIAGTAGSYPTTAVSSLTIVQRCQNIIINHRFYNKIFKWTRVVASQILYWIWKAVDAFPVFFINYSKHIKSNVLEAHQSFKHHVQACKPLKVIQIFQVIQLFQVFWLYSTVKVYKGFLVFWVSCMYSRNIKISSQIFIKWMFDISRGLSLCHLSQMPPCTCCSLLLIHHLTTSALVISLPSLCNNAEALFMQSINFCPFFRINNLAVVDTIWVQYSANLRWVKCTEATCAVFDCWVVYWTSKATEWN